MPDLDRVLNTFSFDWTLIVTDFLRVIIAFVLAFPIAWERGVRGSRSIGLRTFPLVAIASCGYVLVTKSVPGASAESQARVIQGLLAGIGFIGGGAIIKQEGNVQGLATAASIWNTGAIGAAVAFEREEIALVLSVINYVILRVFTPLVVNGRHAEPGDDVNNLLTRASRDAYRHDE